MDTYDDRLDVERRPPACTSARQNGRPDKDRNGDLMTTNNVVVLEMVYLPGISGSPDAQSVGTGEAWVFTGGNKVHGTWTRADRLQPFTLTDDDGTSILLTPGRTFIELPRDSATLAEVTGTRASWSAAAAVDLDALAGDVARRRRCTATAPPWRCRSAGTRGRTATPRPATAGPAARGCPVIARPAAGPCRSRPGPGRRR